MKPITMIKIALPIIAILIIILLFKISAIPDYDFENKKPMKILPRGNGAVVNIWIEEPELKRLESNKIKYLFVDVGDLSSQGEFLSSNEEIQGFVNKAKAHDFILLPYTEINTEEFNFQSETFRQNLVREYFALIGMGFDGIYLDIEPILPEDRDDYIEFLESLHDTLPQNKILGIYSGSIEKNGNEWEWSPEYFEEISNHVDLIFVPGYDSWKSSETEYKSYVQDQVEQLSELDLNANLIYGIPTHKPSPETLSNSLEAYSEEISNQDGHNFIGVGVFAEWTTDENEWEIFRNND